MVSAAPADHYTVLEVPTSASTADIHAAFRRLALIHHPDKGGDAATFRQIREAQEVLTNDDTRAQYDRSRGFRQSCADANHTANGPDESWERYKARVVLIEKLMREVNEKLERLMKGRGVPG